MTHRSSLAHDDDLPSAGRRWGTGAASVLPYLTKSLRAKPADHPQARDARSQAGNPVFADRPRKRSHPC